MSFKRTVRTLLERLTGTSIIRGELPRGVDFTLDVARALPAYSVDVIFDVGANLGHCTDQYLVKCPDAQVHCFEPVSSTFHRLQEHHRGNERVHCHQVALGSAVAKGEMVLEGASSMHFLSAETGGPPATANAKTEAVKITTLDEFCRSNAIDRVSYVKIDTEGADLEVLKGAQQLFSAQKIDFVEVEAGMNTGNDRHVPFETLKKHLEQQNFYLFGIYEQMNEWPKNQPHLRRTNPVFISHTMIELHSKQA